MLIHSIELKSVDSTNDFAKRECASFDQKALTVLVAEKQTSGRGQYDKKWYSTPSQLIVTFVFFAPPLDHSLLVQLLATTVQEVLQTHNLHPTIRWPNDLLINSKKIAGILIETKDSCYIMGLGLNLHLTPEDLLHINQPATCLFQESGKSFDRNKLIGEITALLVQKINSLLLSEGK